MEAKLERLERDLNRLAQFNSTPGAGMTRLTFSEEDRAAREYLMEEMRSAGLAVTVTPHGNIRGRLRGADDRLPAVMIGSHIDSVPHGGRFDGNVGVVGALEVLRVLVEEGVRPLHPVEMAIFAEEEGSRFGTVLAGSRAMIGALGESDLRNLRDNSGIDYLEAMRQAGIKPEGDGAALVRPGDLRAMLELHIEQSVVLEEKGLTVGIVENIAGIRQMVVDFCGVPNHAGATPMGLRKDALAAAAEAVLAIEQLAAGYRQAVGTVGRVICYPGAANVIPGRAEFTVDIRHPDQDVLDAIWSDAKANIRRITNERGLECTIRDTSYAPPIRIAPKVVQVLEDVAVLRGLRYCRMNSGAVHDACNIAKVAPVGMVFVPSIGGRSHCAEEATALEDIKQGVDLCLGAVLKLAKAG
ncbi:MAG: Zn-dependent hydrolase [Actinobacteria bacterium]|nr:Zn-dependent hydrolase [Actinomycetota bacterium]